jgi:hypothetical protein
LPSSVFESDRQAPYLTLADIHIDRGLRLRDQFLLCLLQHYQPFDPAGS